MYSFQCACRPQLLCLGSTFEAGVLYCCRCAFRVCVVAPLLYSSVPSFLHPPNPHPTNPPSLLPNS